MKVDVLIVNLNCLNHTQNLVKLLQKQTYTSFSITLIDQNSSEKGTPEFLSECENNNIKVIKNDKNVPLNFLWNEFASTSKSEYLSFLNNDILVPDNFIKDTIDVLDSSDDIAIAIHVTNNTKFHKQDNLDFKILSENVRQGWDFTIKKRYFTQIPSKLNFYCGDDFLFENVYSQGKKVALIYSSPIIHLLSQTRKNNKIILNRNPVMDVINYKLLGYKHYLTHPKDSNLELTGKMYDWCNVAENK